MQRMQNGGFVSKGLKRKSRPRVIGLTGGIAAGKSTLADGLRRHGAGYYSVDSAAHALYRPGTKIWRSVVGIFGRDIIRDDGSIDRKELGRRVRADSASLRKLERAVHPALRREARRAIRRLRRRYEMTVVEAGPLLFRLGLDRVSDLVVWLDCPRRIRLFRLQSARALSRAEAEEWMRGYRQAEISLRREFGRAPNRIRLKWGKGRKWIEGAVNAIKSRAFSGGDGRARNS